ncbi:MAG: DNA repair protein RecO [Dehalococcoidia bacterium]|nr:DNA repair protein RecO [Dehalococcoidia bacterium]
MAGPRDYQVEGVVIRLADVGERDRIVTLFTRDEGKLAFVARGARRPGSTLGPCVQMLSRGRYQCVRRRALHLITQASAVDSYAKLRAELWSTSCCLYLAELIDAATVEGSPDRMLYDLIVELLDRVNQKGANDVLLRYFELRLLQHTGFCPSLRRCVACGAELRPVENAFSAVLGGVLCPDCVSTAPDASPLSVDALKVLRFWLANPLDISCRTKLDEDLATEIEEHLRRILESVVQRDLRSRAWLVRLRRERLLTGNGEAPTIAQHVDSER